MKGSMGVTPESLITSAAALRSESARIQAALSSLELEVARLRDGWDGAAQVAYDGAQRDWSATFTAMRALLAQVAAQTERTAADYISADKRAAGGFTRR